jgi:hypothetical protein
MRERDVKSNIERWSPKWLAAHISPACFDLRAQEIGAKPLYDRFDTTKNSMHPGNYVALFHRDTKRDQLLVLHTFAKKLVVDGQQVLVARVREIARSITELETNGTQYSSEVASRRREVHLVVPHFDELLQLTNEQRLDVDRFLATHLYDGGKLSFAMTTATDSELRSSTLDLAPLLTHNIFQQVDIA